MAVEPLSTRLATAARAWPAKRPRAGLQRRALALADALAALTALLLVVSWDAGAGLQPWVLAAMPLAVLVNKVTGLYDREELVLRKTTLDEAPSLLQVSGLLALFVFFGQNYFVGAAMGPALVFELWIVTVVGLLIGRGVARRATAARTAPERCLVLGDATAINTVRAKLAEPGLNVKVVAAVDLHRVNQLAAGALATTIGLHRIDRVVVAPVTTDGLETLDLIRQAKALNVQVSVLPRLLEVVGSSVEFDRIEGLTMLGVRSFGLTRSSLLLKRLFDLVVASLLLVASAPIMALIALAIRVDTRGPILFRQSRVGRDDEPFEILKFRTMVPDAEQRKGDVLHLNETQGLFKIACDPRVTRVGRLLRSTSLDELPQLVNVWRGDMSLVGPRPLVADEDAKVEGLDRSRLHLTPGMTGDWQILGSTRVPLREMVGIDYLYVANWSLWTDVKIMLRTVPFMLRRSGT